MAEMDTAHELAAYARDLRLSDVDEETLDAAKVRIVDSLASAIGAARLAEPSVEQVIAFSAGQSDDEDAHVLGTDRRAAVEYAAFANASLIRYLDWNDYHAEPNRHGTLSIGHASSNLGALLSVAEANGNSGEELLLATVLAYELHLRMADETAQYDDGLDHVNYGLVASTLAVGRLRRLSPEELAQAVNIAIAGNLALYQTRCGELTEWKGFAFGNTVRNAVVAVDLAEAGINGPAPIFEGKAGFSNLLSHPIDPDVGTFGGNGGDYRLPDTSLKPYPICGALQEPVENALGFLSRQDVDWREITGVEVLAGAGAIDLCAAEEEKWDPQNRNTADHSMPYCLARAFVDGEVGLAQFTPEKIADPEIRELMEKVTVTEDPDRSLLRVETESDSYEVSVEHPRGHPERPFTDDELAEKLGTAFDVPRDDESVAAILSWADDLEERSSVSALFDLARVR